MKIFAIQPPYYWGENPGEEVSNFLMDKLKDAEENSLTVLPEYSNAGGLSDKNEILGAIPRAEIMLKAVSKIAKERKCYIAINVLERRAEELKNTTYLFDKQGKAAFLYDKVHLPPSEKDLGIIAGDGSCTFELDGIRFAFMTCYDVYYNEQIEFIANYKPDIIIIPSYQRSERIDIIISQVKLIAFRCNAYVIRASFSMNDENKGGCSLIAAPDGQIIKNIGNEIGSIFAEVEPKNKYTRTSGYGGNVINNDEFIAMGLRPDIFK